MFVTNNCLCLDCVVTLSIQDVLWSVNCYFNIETAKVDYFFFIRITDVPMYV